MLYLRGTPNSDVRGGVSKELVTSFRSREEVELLAEFGDEVRHARPQHTQVLVGNWTEVVRVTQLLLFPPHRLLIFLHITHNIALIIY